MARGAGGLLDLELDGDHLGGLSRSPFGLAEGRQLVALQDDFAGEAAQHHVALAWGGRTPAGGLLEDQGDALRFALCGGRGEGDGGFEGGPGPPRLNGLQH